MSLWEKGKRLFGAGSAQLPSAPSPEAKAIQPGPPPPATAAKPEFSDRETSRIKYVLQGATDFGPANMGASALIAILADDNLLASERKRQVLAHPDFETAYTNILNRRRFENLPLVEKMQAQMHVVPEVITNLENVFAAQPHTRLYHADERPQRERTCLCWRLVYSRIAGTMSEKEQFVFIFATALEAGYLDGRDNIDLLMVAALGSRADIEWQRVHHNGDEDKHAEWIKNLFEPHTIDYAYEHAIELLMSMERNIPYHPIVEWGLKRLRPSSHSWATSR